MVALASVQLGSGRGQVGVPGSVCSEHGVLVGEPGGWAGADSGMQGSGYLSTPVCYHAFGSCHDQGGRLG